MCVVFNQLGKLAAGCLDPDHSLSWDVDFSAEGTLEVEKSDGTIAGVGDPGQEAAAILPLLEVTQLAARAEENLDLFDKAMQLLINRHC